MGERSTGPRNSQEAGVAGVRVRKDSQEVKSGLGGRPDPLGPPRHCKDFDTLSEVQASGRKMLKRGKM